MKTSRIFALFILMLLAAGSPAGVRAVSPAAPPSQGGALEASNATMPAGTRVHFDMTSEPPVLTDEQRAVYEQHSARGPLPAASPLPVGDTAADRPDSAADPRTATGQGVSTASDQPDAPSAPGTFTLFRDVSFGATIKFLMRTLANVPRSITRSLPRREP